MPATMPVPAVSGGVTSRELELQRELCTAKALLGSQMELLRKTESGFRPVAPSSTVKSGSAMPVLPDGWKSATDPASKRVYYYNKALGLSQFEEPKVHGSPPLPPPPAPLLLTHQEHPAQALVFPPQTPAERAHVTAEGSRPCQAARLRAMMPFLDGAQRAYTAGELAVLDFIDRR